MKSIFIHLSILLSAFQSFGQSGTIMADGIMVPKVSSLTTCASPSKGQMVFLNTDNKLYYCNGSAWQGPSDFSLPYNTTSSSSSDLFKISNTGMGGGLSASIINSTNNDYAVYGFSNGMGSAALFYNDNPSGHALQTVGKIKFSMQGGGKDKVLTSDSEGNATWKQGINHNVAFAARGLVINENGLSFYPTKTYTKVNFKNIDYDIGNNFSISNDAFTAPINGIYHFDVQIKQVTGINSDNWYSLSLWTFDNYKLIEVYCSNEVSQSASLSTDIQLLAGMTVTAKVYPNNEYNTAFYPEVELSRFSGHLVSRFP